MEHQLTLRYTPEKQDYVRASRALALKSSWFVYLALLILLVLAGSGFILVNPAIVGPMIRGIAVILFVVCLVYVIYFVFIIPIHLARAYKRTEHLRQERILIFWKDHLQMEIGGGSLSLSWEDLRRVVAGKKYYLLIFEDEQKVFPFIPRRGLDDGDRRAFLEFFQSKSIPII